MCRHLVLVFTMLTPATALLAQSRFEVTPFAGFRVGGSFRALEQAVTIEMQDSAGFGVLFDFTLTETMAVEFSWSHQRTTTELGEGGPVEAREAIEQILRETGQLEAVEQAVMFDIGIDYYHGSFVYGGGTGGFRPYVLVGAGVAVFDPDAAAAPDAPTLNRFSFNVGTGFKTFFNDRIGFRFDARAFGTRIGERQEDVACGVFGCVSFEVASTFWQGHLVGGLIVTF